jgi:HemY protein
VKVVLKLLILLAVALMIAMLSSVGPGHVILFFDKYRVDLSLTALLVIILFTFLVVYYLIRFWVNLNRLPNKIRKWRAKQALLQGRNYLNSAGIHYFEGKYGNACNNALKSTSKEINKDNKFLALMLAFKSATFMRDYEKQEALLEELNNYKDKKWQLAKFMATAESQYAEHKYSLCLENLNQVILLDKRHIPARRIMLKVYLRLNNYEKAFEVLSWLTKHDYLERSQAESYKLQVLSGLFNHISDAAELHHFYRKLDKKDRDNPLVNKFYFDALIRLKQFPVAIELVEELDGRELSYGLGENIILLAKKTTEEKQAQRLLAACEKYLLTNKQNAKLLLALGIVCFTLKLWENAKSYIEASLTLKPTIDSYLYLSFIGKAMNNQMLAEHAEHMLVENLHTLV